MRQLLTAAVYTAMYQDIVDFRNQNLLPVNTPDKFTIEDDQLHDKLFMEEDLETILADTQVNRADGIVDTAYVIMGRMVHLGLRNVADAFAQHPALMFHIEKNLTHCEAIFKTGAFKRCWDEIHKSNMTKACQNGQERDKTIAHYKKLKIKTEAIEVNGKFIIKVAEDATVEISGEEKHFPKGKVLKNFFYKPAELANLI